MKNCTRPPINIPIKALIMIVFALKIIPVITASSEIPMMMTRYLFLIFTIEIYFYSESFSTRESFNLSNSAFTNSNRSIREIVSEIFEFVVKAIRAPSRVYPFSFTK